MDWWLELDASPAFARFLEVLEEARRKRERALVLARGTKGALMTNDEYHGTAGEVRGLLYAIGVVDKARSQEPKDE